MVGSSIQVSTHTNTHSSSVHINLTYRCCPAVCIHYTDVSPPEAVASTAVVVTDERVLMHLQPTPAVHQQALVRVHQDRCTSDGCWRTGHIVWQHTAGRQLGPSSQACQDLPGSAASSKYANQQAVQCNNTMKPHMGRNAWLAHT